MRRHEKDFMLWRDDKYAAEFSKAVVAFTRVLTELNCRIRCGKSFP